MTNTVNKSLDKLHKICGVIVAFIGLYLLISSAYRMIAYRDHDLSLISPTFTNDLIISIYLSFVMIIGGRVIYYRKDLDYQKIPWQKFFVLLLIGFGLGVVMLYFIL